MSEPQSLVEFLARWPADTDARLAGWVLDAEQTLRCTLETSPWWVPPAERTRDGGRLAITLRAVTGGIVRLGWRPAEVEDLEAVVSEPEPHGRPAAVFGNAPLRDPAGFYAAFADLVTYDFPTDAPLLAYVGARYAEWAARVAGPGPYHLLEAPERVVATARPLLDARTEGYTVLVGAGHRPDPPLIRVTIGESEVHCRAATVVATPPASG